MVWNDWIVKYVKVFVVFWILVVIFMVLFVVKLSDFINYSIDQFLLKDVELVKIMDILEKEFLSFIMSENQIYMIIYGIDVNDLKMRDVYERFKVEVKFYGDNFILYYDVFDIFQNEFYNIILNIIKIVVNLSGIFYDFVVNGSDIYRMFFFGIENLIN